MEPLFKELMGQSPFPLNVYPRSIQEYIKAWSLSLTCSVDLLAVPLLGVAGAAIGRAGRCPAVKEGWVVSSCLWTVCIAGSSEGKSPALSAVDNYYMDKQLEEERKWREAKRAHEKDQDGTSDPGPQPQLFLTDTTTEALRYVLASGPTLYKSDELAAWCNQMSQYKAGNADKPAWTSFWSHAPVSVGRRSDSLTVHRPFVAVVGMLVPGSVHELNYRGHSDDGFVHRMLIACPPPSRLFFSPVGVPEELIARYKQEMTRLFEPGGRLQRDNTAFLQAAAWCNNFHYGEADGKGAPEWLRAKYKKLWDNLWRVALVIHELRRVAETEDERETPFDPLMVDKESVDRAIRVVDYFKDHIYRVQALLGEGKMDDIDALHRRFYTSGKITVRQFMQRSSKAYRSTEQANSVFREWQKRGYGAIGVGDRKDQVVFVFGVTPDMVTEA